MQASEGTPGRGVLGRDPFEIQNEFDPFAEVLEATIPARRPTEPPEPDGPESVEPEQTARSADKASDPARSEDSAEDSAEDDGVEQPRPRKPTPIEKPRWSSTPRLAEIEPQEPATLLEHWLGAEARRRLASLQHLVETEVSYDRFGMSPDTLRRAFPFFYALYRYYFRVQSCGHDNVPTRGPAVLASNHGGLLPFDGAMLVIDLLLETDPPRLARAIVDRWAGNLPWVNIFYARVGQVVGTRENFADLLDDGQLVLVFPEGTAGVRKPITQRNHLQGFHVGFVEEALRAGAPIVPTAVIGTDDQAPILYDFQGLARQLGLPALPITPTFPWLGPLGLLPYPVRYTIVYGEPLPFHERFGPEDAEDARLVRYLARQVRHKVQQLVDRER